MLTEKNTEEHTEKKVFYCSQYLKILRIVQVFVADLIEESAIHFV